MLLQSTGPFTRIPTNDIVFANMVTYVMIDLFVYVVRVLFQFTRLAECSFTSNIRAVPGRRAYRLIMRPHVNFQFA